MVAPGKRQAPNGRSLTKDFVRELKNNFARFFSLFLIVALGVSFYTGIRAAAPDMRDSANQYLNSQNFMDLRIVSSLGLREADLVALQSLDIVEDLSAALLADVYLEDGEQTPVVRIHDLPDPTDQHALNKPLLLEGRWPETSDEIVVDDELILRSGYTLGDTVSFSRPDDSIYTLDEATIVGVVQSPAYISLEREPTTLGTGTLSYYIYAPWSAFDADYYTDIYVTISGLRAYSTYDEEYDEALASATSRIEMLMPGLVLARRDDLVEEAEAELLPHIQDLADAREEADEEFAKSQQDLIDAKQAIEDGQAEIDEGYNALAELETMQEQLQAMGDQEQAAALAIQIEMTRSALLDAEAKLEQGRSDLTDGEREYAEALASAEAEFAEAEEEIAEARADIAAIPKGEVTILNRDTNIGIVTYGENADRIEAISRVFPLIFFLVAALISMTSMSRMVEDERSQIGTLKALGYSNRQTLNKYLLFALLASLLGGVIGGFFGLYFFPYLIMDAYGTIYKLPAMLITMYPDIIILGIVFACISTISGVLLSAVPAVRLSPAELMRPPAPKPGKRIWLESIKPVWKRMSFSYKVSFRNMFRYKKRLFMTLFGIGGCTALLLTAFGLRDSLSAVVSDQFDSVFHYDLVVTLDSEISDLNREKINTRIDELDGDTMTLQAYGQEITALATDADRTKPLREISFSSGISVLVAESSEDFASMIELAAPLGSRYVELDDDGVILTTKLANRLGVKAGDDVVLSKFLGVSGSAVGNGVNTDVFDESVTVHVSDVTLNYLGHYVYMDQAYFETLDLEHADRFTWNSIYVRSDKLEDREVADALASDLLKIKHVNQVSFVEQHAENLSSSMETLDSVVVILILAAGLLAVLVLYNLNNINISERKREIATLKVLGFNRKELASYIYRENVFLMMIGIVLGLLAGVFLHRYLITTVEVDLTHFGRIIKPLSWLYSVLLTTVFSLGVNLGMYNKIQKTDMVESLKSIE